MDNLQKARFNMIHQQIKPYSVTDNAILDLMSKIPREDFMPKGFEAVAYSDTPIPLGDEHFMLPPKTIARALQALKIQPHETVLEIGTGTGYTTMIMANLAEHLYSAEIDQALFEQATKNLSQGCPNVTLVQRDCALGWEQHAPYDVIFVSGSYPIELPPLLVEQLNNGGRCFAVVGTKPAMQATIFTKIGQTLEKEILFETNVPPLVNAPKYPEFTF